MHLTGPNAAIKPSIVDYLLASKSVGASGDTAVNRGPKYGHRIHVQRMITGYNLGVTTYGCRIDGIVKLLRG